MRQHDTTTLDALDKIRAEERRDERTQEPTQYDERNKPWGFIFDGNTRKPSRHAWSANGICPGCGATTALAQHRTETRGYCAQTDCSWDTRPNMRAALMTATWTATRQSL